MINGIGFQIAKVNCVFAEDEILDCYQYVAIIKHRLKCTVAIFYKRIIVGNGYVERHAVSPDIQIGNVGGYLILDANSGFNGLVSADHYVLYLCSIDVLDLVYGVVNYTRNIAHIHL